MSGNDTERELRAKLGLLAFGLNDNFFTPAQRAATARAVIAQRGLADVVVPERARPLSYRQLFCAAYGERL